MPELVSILIPAYNADRWLAGTVRSALAQTWPRFEVIVVDDGSGDDTLGVARTFEGRRVKVVTQPNQGACAARNRALALAQGDYIQWLDADDLLHPHKIGAQMRIANSLADHSILLSGPFGTFYHRPEKATFVPTALWAELTPIDYFLIRFTQNVFFQTGAWLISRELTNATGIWTDVDSPDDDGEYFCRAVATGNGVSFVKDAAMYYRVGNYRALNKARSRHAETALFGSKVKCIRHLLALEDSARTRAASVRLLQEWLPDFYPHRPDIVKEAGELAQQLGGELRTPVLRAKYRPIEWMFGYQAAASATRLLPRVRAQIACKVDEYLYRVSSSGMRGREHNLQQS